MTEVEFINQIDCRFPYTDEAVAFALVDQAARISVNACFMIGEELCRPPISVNAPAEMRLAILLRLRSAFQHPLRDRVLDAAEAAIRGQVVNSRDALAILQEAGQYRGQYCALNIVCACCGSTGEDEIQSEYESIVQRWEAT